MEAALSKIYGQRSMFSKVEALHCVRLDDAIEMIYP
jgi:hypothetical protein